MNRNDLIEQIREATASPALLGAIVDGGIDLGDGARLAVVEPLLDRSGQQIRFGDGLMAVPAFRLLVPDGPDTQPEEGL